MDVSGSRKVDRRHVLLKATILAAEGEQEVRIKDLSSSGAQIACASPLRTDRDVIFKRGAIFAAARVAWSDSECAGLEFYRQLEPMAFGSDRTA